MEYTNVNGFQLPLLEEDEIGTRPIGKYGRLRREFLREHRPVLFDEMTIDGSLYPHLIQIEDVVRFQVSSTVNALAEMLPMPDRRTDPLGWARQMNALKAQAEEEALSILYE